MARSGTISARPNAERTPPRPPPRPLPCRTGGAEGSRGSQAEEGSRACRGTRRAGRPCGTPSAVDPKYSKETAGKARMHTCVDQYNANKASNANGGMKWIQKGGGYYSECNKKLKG